MKVNILNRMGMAVVISALSFVGTSMPTDAQQQAQEEQKQKQQDRGQRQSEQKQQQRQELADWRYTSHPCDQAAWMGHPIILSRV